jgi:type II secretory pathway pseudopilin PulG
MFHVKRRAAQLSIPPWRCNRRAGFSLAQLLIVIALIALAIAFLIPIIERTRTQSSFVLCQDRLRQVGNGLIQYAHQDHGHIPVSDTIDGPQHDLIQSLAASQCLGDPKNYYCPAQQLASLSFSDDNFKSGVIGYYYYSALNPSINPQISKFIRTEVSWPRKLDMSMDPMTWVMSDIWVSGVETAHGGYRKGVNYLMLNGSVGFIAESPRQAFR